MSDAEKSNQNYVLVIGRKRPEACASCAGNEASSTQNVVSDIPRTSREDNPFNFYAKCGRRDVAWLQISIFRAQEGELRVFAAAINSIPMSRVHCNPIATFPCLRA